MIFTIENHFNRHLFEQIVKTCYFWIVIYVVVKIKRNMNKKENIELLYIIENNKYDGTKRERFRKIYRFIYFIFYNNYL